MGNPEVLIRKYSDRRLYNASASRYVKLEDIARMVRDGIDVRVVDDRTGKDITQVIYTQIIVENAREREIALPLQLLTQLVRTSDKATHDFLTWYLDSTIDLYQKAQDTVHSRISDAKRAVSSPLDFVRGLLSQYSNPHVDTRTARPAASSAGGKKTRPSAAKSGRGARRNTKAKPKARHRR